MSISTNGRRVVELAVVRGIPGLVVEHLDPDRHAAPLAELICQANEHDGVDWRPTPENLRHDWEHNEGFDIAEDLLVAEVDERVIGFVELDWRQRAEGVFHQVFPVVHPAWRHRGLGRALLEWAEGRVMRGVAAGVLGPRDAEHFLAGWGDLEIPDVVRFAASTGYEPHTYGVMMTRPLSDPVADAPLPPGLDVRAVRPEDHRRIWDADCEAFQDHRNPAVRTDADFESWFTIPELDTGLWEVAWDGDEVAGSVMAFVWPGENARLGVKRAWLEHISVRRPWRRRGLASALITRSLARFKALGFDDVALGADAENLTGAVRVYEALGFRRTRTAAGYRKALEAVDGGREAAPTGANA